MYVVPLCSACIQCIIQSTCGMYICTLHIQHDSTVVDVLYCVLPSVCLSVVLRSPSPPKNRLTGSAHCPIPFLSFEPHLIHFHPHLTPHSSHLTLLTSSSHTSPHRRPPPHCRRRRYLFFSFFPFHSFLLIQVITDTCHSFQVRYLLSARHPYHSQHPRHDDDAPLARRLDSTTRRFDRDPFDHRRHHTPFTRIQTIHYRIFIHHLNHTRI